MINIGKHWMKKLAILLACAMAAAQMPVAPVFAQEINAPETSKMSEPFEAAADVQTAAESEGAGAAESGTAEGVSTETVLAEADGETNEETNEETNLTEADGEANTKTDIEADGESDTETDPNPKETSADPELPARDSTEGGAARTESRVRYILGREMTEREIAAQKAMEPDYLPEMEVAALPEEAAKISAYSLRRNALPEKYDARERGSLPAVRNQNPWGVCWTFAFLGIMENSLIRQGYETAESADLSERHLAYFTYHTGYDALDNANDDSIDSSPQNFYLKSGGNDYKAAIRLMNWQGAAKEGKYPYTAELPDSLAQGSAQDSSAYLKNCIFYPAGANNAETRETVKSLIMDYECVSWSYYQDAAYYNYSTAAYYNDKVKSTNHAIIVVGWDDSYAKENFRTSPQNDGAWIVRNSWGSGWGEEGYFYISYEDISLGSGNAACAAEAEPAGGYDNNYFHGNSLGLGKWGKYKKAAQIYQMKSPHAVRERLAAVSFMAASADTEYEIQIYKNPQMAEGVVQNPESGTAMLDEPLKGTVSYAGVYTVDLPEPVVFEADDYMAVVLSFSVSSYMYCDGSETMNTPDGSYTAVNAVEAGESLYMLSSKWQDMSVSGRSLRINALTVDLPDIVTMPILSVSETQAADFESMPTVQLKWNKCSGAQGYEAYRSSDGTTYEKIADVISEKRNYTEILPDRADKTYLYKVRALYQDGFEESDAVRCHISGAVEGVQLALSHDGKTAAFSWKAIKGADCYELQKKEAQGYQTIQTIPAADESEHEYTQDISDVALGSYPYRVRAVKGAEYSQWSEAVLTKDLEAAQQSCDAVKLTWLPVEAAVKYRVRILVGGTWYIYPAEDTSYALSFSGKKYEVQIGEDYKYRVLAYDADDTVIYTSSTIAFRLVPDALESVSAEYGSGVVNVEDVAVTVSWSGGSGAAKVDLYRSLTLQELGERIAAADAADGVYIDASGFEYGKTYFYRLMPWMKNQAGETVSGAVTEAVKVHIPPAAAELSPARCQDGAVALEWTPALGADGYLIEKSVNAEAFVRIADVNATSYLDSMVSRCNQYRYRVTSYHTSTDGSLVKGIVSAIEEIALLPDPVIITEITEEKGTVLAVRLPMAETAQSYLLYRAEGSSMENAPNDGAQNAPNDGAFGLIAEGLTGGVYRDADVKPDTAYYYKALVTTNGLTSSLAETMAKKATTKPLLQGLSISLEQSDMLKNSSQEILLSAMPSHYPYARELVWMAADENGSPLEIRSADGSLAVMGNDSKEALRIAGSTIIATGESEDRTVYLSAAIDGIAAECRVSIYDNGFWIADVGAQTYTGAAIAPNVRVYDRSRLLTEGVDYTISYKNNVNANDASNPSKAPTITVAGIGNYSGKETVAFKILPKDIAGHAVLADGLFCAYNKKTQKPLPVLTWNGRKLKKGRDFEVEYTDMAKGAYQEAGVYAILIKGKNNFKGTREVSLTITQGGLISKANVSRVPNQTYTGEAVEPALVVKSGKTILAANQDYTVRYENNVAIGTATAVIAGNGVDYFGTKRVTFSITGTQIKKATVTGLEKSFVYTGREIKPAGCTLTLKTAQGSKTLTEGEDYEVHYADNIHAGTASVLFIGKNGFTGTLKKTFRITPYDLNADTKGLMAFEMEKEAPYAKAGSKPQPTVLFQSRQGNETESFSVETLELGKDYKLSYQHNKTIASAAKHPAVVITGIGDFKGKKTLGFTIVRQDIGLLTIHASDKAYVNQMGMYQTTLTVTDLDGRTLKAGKDYAKEFVCAYAEQTTLPNGTVRGKGEAVARQDNVPYGTPLNVTVMGISNYLGTLTGQYRIVQYDIRKAKITVKSQIYTGKPIEPGKDGEGVNADSEILVQYKGKKLKYGEDYEIAGYENNTKKGAGKVIIKGTGSYGGTKNVKFVIRSKTVLWGDM